MNALLGIFSAPLARLLFCVGLVLTGAGIGWTVQGWHMSSQIQKARAERAQDLAAHANGARVYAEKVIAIRSEVDQVIEKGVQDERRKTAASDRALAEQHVVRKRLLNHIVGLARSTAVAVDPATPERGSADEPTGPGLVLARLYESVDDEASQLARALDRSRRAGLLCERSYNAVRDTLMKYQKQLGQESPL